MAIHLADSLLALAASIDADGGHGVCRTLASLLRDAAPFDAGEVVLRQEEGFHRFPFGTDERPVAGDDVVSRVLATGTPLRLDDQRDLDSFPETRDRMALAGLKSALVLPLGIILHVQTSSQASSPSGVLALARRHGWAFVGASLNFLGPLSAMAGFSLDRSLALTVLGHPAGLEPGADVERRNTLRREGATLIAELQKLRVESATSSKEAEALRSRLAEVRDELAEARSAAIAAQSALDQAVNRCHELQARLDRRDVTPPREGAEPATVPERASADPSVYDEAAKPRAHDEPVAAASLEPAPAEAPVLTLTVASPPAADRSRRGRRRRRGAFEPSGGAGAT